MEVIIDSTYRIVVMTGKNTCQAFSKVGVLTPRRRRDGLKENF